MKILARAVKSSFVALLFIVSPTITFAGELSPKGKATVRAAGFDPESPLVKSVADEKFTFKGDPATLDYFAEKGSKDETRQIIVMRAFIREYKKDKSTKSPSQSDWNGEFLSKEELALVKPVIDRNAEELVKKLFNK